MQRTHSVVGGCTLYYFVLYICASLKRNVVCWCIHMSRIVFVILQNSFFFWNWVFCFCARPFSVFFFLCSVKVQSSSRKGGLCIPWCSYRGSKCSFKVHQHLKQQKKLHRANISFRRIITCNIVSDMGIC